MNERGHGRGRPREKMWRFRGAARCARADRGSSRGSLAAMAQAKRSDRVVAVGDLNGAYDVLVEILLGTEIIDERERWIGGPAHLILIGDIFNRGPNAREIFQLVGELSAKAEKKRGRVTILLGNHETMVALGNEAYCTTEEYLAFATEKQKSAWQKRVDRAMREIYNDYPVGGPIRPILPRLEEWKARHVPGQGALRRAVGPRGEIGRVLRQLPIAVIDQGCVFCHAPITPSWARLGVEGLNRAAREAWETAPKFFADLPQDHLFYAQQGPLWNRRMAKHETARTRRQLDGSLARLEVKRMVVGHTPTNILPHGERGRIALRHDDKLVCIDVGLGRGDPSPCTALVVQDGKGIEWSPLESRLLWKDKSSTRRPRSSKKSS